MLTRRPLGKSGPEVSVLSLGTVKFGRNQGVRYPDGFDLPRMGTLKQLLALAEELGINLLDTAPAYGSSEARLGELIKGRRHHWLLSTKVGEAFRDGVSSHDYSLEAVELSIANSLKNLGTDYLDLVFVHSNGQDKQIITQSPVLEVLGRFKEKGIIRQVGFSGYIAEECLLAFDLVDAFMITFNASDQSQASLIEACQQQQKGVVIKKAMESGHTADPAAALQFVVNYPGVTSVVMGTINPDHLARNVRAIDA